MADKKLVIFDFDGVLVRTSDIGYILHTNANPHLSIEYFNDLSNGNFVENLNRAIREDGYRVQENWEDLYHDELLKLSSHDVIRGLVHDLVAKYALIIVSSSQSYHIRDFVKQEGLDGCFEEILGSDVDSSKVVKIRRALMERNLTPSDAVFVTDTVGDLREGRECSVACIGVTWGHHSRERLMEGNPYAVVDTVPELETAIEKFFMLQ